MDLLKRLEAIVGPAHVLSGPAAEAHAVDGRSPRVAAFPASEAEVGAVLAACGEARAAVVPWGGGTGIGVGNAPSRLDVVLGLTRLAGVLEHEPADMTSTVRAGTVLTDYQQVLGKNGQWLPLDPPHADHATIGGLLAVNGSGPLRYRYGTLRDQLIGLRIAHADGTVTKAGAKVVKNVTGYDLNKLYVGSLGTLGVIVEATFRLYPRPTAEETWVGAFPSASAASDGVVKLLDSPIVASAIELLHPAADFLGSMLPGAGSAVAVLIGSVPDAVQAQLEAVEGILLAGGATSGCRLAGERQAALWSAVRDPVWPAGGVAVKATMLPSAVGGFVERAQALAEEHDLRLRWVSEAASGVVRLHAAAQGPTSTETWSALLAVLRKKAEDARGAVTVFDAPPDIKAGLDVWGPVRALPLMQALKRAFDPEGILSPGRFVGGL